MCSYLVYILKVYDRLIYFDKVLSDDVNPRELKNSANSNPGACLCRQILFHPFQRFHAISPKTASEESVQPAGRAALFL